MRNGRSSVWLIIIFKVSDTTPLKRKVLVIYQYQPSVGKSDSISIIDSKTDSTDYIIEQTIELFRRISKAYNREYFVSFFLSDSPELKKYPISRKFVVGKLRGVQITNVPESIIKDENLICQYKINKDGTEKVG